MKRAHEDVRMMNMSCKRQLSHPRTKFPPQYTYSEEAVNACPHGVVGQLSPAALVHDCPLVHAATDEVYEDCDNGDDTEDAAGAERLFGLMHAAAGEGGAAFEEVGAFVDGGDEGDAGFGERVRVAEERDDGCLATRVLVFVARGLLLTVLIIFVVGVVPDDLAGCVRQGNRLALWFRGTRGAV
jgi:hypothetical protein